MKKYIDSIIVPFTTVLILLVSVWLVTVTITGGKWYYRWQFEKNGTVDKLTWVTKDGERITYDEEDLEMIMNQMVDYLMGKEKDMQVVIDGKNVFSNQAIYHMRDVKALYSCAVWLERGYSGKPEPHQALNFYEYAAAQGHQNAMATLISIYSGGTEIPANKERAEYWKKQLQTQKNLKYQLEK